MRLRTPAQQRTDRIRTALRFLLREQRVLNAYMDTLPLSGQPWSEHQDAMYTVMHEYVSIAAHHVAELTGWTRTKGSLIEWAQRTA